jgi:hypothetical protein
VRLIVLKEDGFNSGNGAKGLVSCDLATIYLVYIQMQYEGYFRFWDLGGSSPFQISEVFYLGEFPLL